MITGDQIRQARKLLGWHRGQIAIRARGITGNTVGKAEGAHPGKPPTPEQLAEIRAVLEAAGVEFTDGEPAGVGGPTSSPRPLASSSICRRTIPGPTAGFWAEGRVRFIDRVFTASRKSISWDPR